MLQVQARPSTVDGAGVGRWRNMYRAEDLREARRYVAGYLTPSCHVRVKDGKAVVLGPSRARDVSPDATDADFRPTDR